MKTGSAVAAALAVAQVQGADEHPVEKVIALLKDLHAQVESEAQAEEVAYSKYTHWCQVSTKTLKGAIVGEKEKIETLKSEIEGEEKGIHALGQQIAALEKEINENEQSGTKAQGIRDTGASLFTQSSADIQATIDAIANALTALEEAKGGGGASFVAKLSTPKLRSALALADLSLPASFPAPQRAALTNLLQQDPEPLAAGDAAEHEQQYKFKSGDVVEMLKSLKLKFEDDLVAANTAETNALNSFALEKQARDASIKAATDSKTEKETAKGEVEESLATHKGELSEVEGDLETDSKTLSDTESGCSMKKQEWEERSKTREKEMEAMKVAESILAKVTGVRTEKPSNPVPPPAPVEAETEEASGGEAPAAALVQVADPRQQALNLLKSKAKQMKSHELAKMVQELSAHVSDPFGEVNNMIEKMIFRLKAEQTEEDNHKHWCEQEVNETNASRTDKETKIEALSLKEEAAEANIQQTTMEIEAADGMVAKLTSFVAEAEEIRQTGKEENSKALKDAQDAQKAIANAVAVLEEFYKSSGMMTKQAWEFVQRGKGKQPVELPEDPSTWESSYTGVTDPQSQPAGIVTVLQAVAADFAAMEADTQAQEAEDQKAFETEMKQAAIDKAQRSKESEMKNSERKRLSDKLAAMKEKHKHLDGELEAVNQYYHDLGPACLDGDSSYEDRKAARDAEIGALKEAEQILAEAFNDNSTAPAEESGAFLAKKIHVAAISKH
eukprot:TRINITY_DN4973_c0_g3_i1.p1 TRINITY_DN4973_c0_g3~~TRINITY_DN4973_c0_g3_i1.p1  ORF type:complete len:731 (+),score=354.71 TRINITY_DN4973_c0_g3_i1:54-2246(+)